jgi:hypothetical protein
MMKIGIAVNCMVRSRKNILYYLTAKRHAMRKSYADIHIIEFVYLEFVIFKTENIPQVSKL